MRKDSNVEGGEQSAAKHPSGHTHETSCVALVKVEPTAPALGAGVLVLSRKNVRVVGKPLREVFVVTDADANGDNVRHHEVGGKNGEVNGSSTDACAGEFYYDG